MRAEAPSSLSSSLPSLIAHRGESAIAPENTLAAIALAAKNGAQWVEIDVNISSDGVPYVHHDDGLSRCTDGAGYLILKTATELDTLDAGSWFSKDFKGEPLPTLAAVTTLLHESGMGLNLEIKPSAGWEIPTTDAICDFLLEHWPTELPLLISSFSTAALLRARQRMPELPLGLLVCAIPPDWQQQMRDLDCQTFHCGAAFVTADNANAINNAGYPILCFTVNDADQAEQLLAWGVSSVISDHPSRLAAELGKRL